MTASEIGPNSMRTALISVLALLTSLVADARQSSSWQRLEAPRAGQRILIVAAHVDDEGLAAGGYASDAVAAGAEVYLVYLTAGDHSRTALVANRLTFFSTSRLNHKGEMRVKEGLRAADRVGIAPAQVFLLGYPDRGLRKMISRPESVIRSASTGNRAVPYPEALSPGAPYRLSSIVRDLEQVITSVQPDIVIAPSLLDHHPDHRAAAQLVDRTLGDLDLHPERLDYVIHSGTRSFAAAHLAGCDGCMLYPLGSGAREKKREMLAEYRSQHRSPYLLVLFGRARASYEVFIHAHS